MSHFKANSTEVWRQAVGQYFYVTMSLLILGIVVYGFSFTIDKSLLHAPQSGRILRYTHGAIFSGWLLLFIVQIGLIRIRRISLHRALGWFGVLLGIAVIIAGFWITIVTQPRLLWRIGLFSMGAFAVFLCLAVHFRLQPEHHKRLMLMSSCVLTSAAFARFPRGVPFHAILFHRDRSPHDAWGDLGSLAHEACASCLSVGLPLFICIQMLVVYPVFSQQP